MRFFPSFQALKQFLSQLHYQKHGLTCPRCHCTHFVAHDWVRKALHFQKSIIVGKRLFCSNRGPHAGCGATLRLYATQRIPGLFYSAQHVSKFITALIQGLSIAQAYRVATQTNQARHAYRWMQKLSAQSVAFRICLQKNYRINSTHTCVHNKPFSTPHRHALMSTLHSLWHYFGQSISEHFQLKQQIPFI